MTKVTENKKVYLALSGGVDSAVSAYLLKEQGYDVVGCFMKNWSGSDFGIVGDCPWEADQKDAEAVCKHLDIPFRSFNFEKEYRARVIKYFFDEIKNGRTPNPDVLCNREIKFGIFLDKALENGADLIATGHYARVQFDEKNKEYELLKGIDDNKDQSYFLCELNQVQLSKSLFPVGGYTKPEIRKIAEQQNLPVAFKPDSQGICFIGKINVGKFLRDNVKVHSGDIIDIDSREKVGTHDGIEFYTIGQREGLNIGGASEPYFVSKKDMAQNILYVAKGKSNPQLFSKIVQFENLVWINNIQNVELNNLTAQIRYRQKAVQGKLDLEKNIFVFDDPQRAVAEGQLLAIYEGEILRASATIK